MPIESLNRLVRRSMLGYALFLLPTLVWLLYGGPRDADWSRHIAETWQAGYWHLPGLSGVATRIALDVLEIPVLLLLGIWFWQGYRLLGRDNKDAPASTGNQSDQPLLVGRTVLTWVLLAGLVLVAVIPFHSSDLYGYINRGFQQSLYHTNPYLTPVAEIPGWNLDPRLHPHWIYNPCPYGFLFAMLAAGLTALCGGLFVPVFLAFKLLNLLALLAATGLVARIAQAFKRPRPWQDAYLLGANPLVMLHAIGNGHNDILMVTLLLASFWCLLQRRWAWLALPVLTLSVLIKYASILAGPPLLIYLFRTRQIKALLAGALLSGVIALGLAWPYIPAHHPWPWAALLDNAGKPQHSLIDLLARLVYYSVKPIAGKMAALNAMDTALHVLKPLFWGGFIVFYAMQCGRILRGSLSPERVFYTCGLTLTVMVALISAKFHPWYPVMFLPVLLVLPPASRLRRFGLMFSLFQLAAFTILQNVHILGVLLLTLLPLWLTWTNRDWFNADA